MRNGIIACLLLAISSLAWSTTTITYQGQLQDNGQPFNGQADLTFELYDDFDPNDPSVGNSVAGPISVNDVDVSDGLFQVDLDFGAVYELPVWIEITVGTDTLHPRQRFASTPVAVHALNVSSTSGAWMLGGNAGTDPATDFVGTIDAAPFEIHVNGQRALQIQSGSSQSRPSNWIAGHAANGIESDVSGATIAGGGTGAQPNVVSGELGTIGGGVDNLVSNAAATIGGGFSNEASGLYSTIGGGLANIANGFRATIGGGEHNTASGEHSTVSGGFENEALGDNSFAAGLRSKALHHGSFVWADGIDSAFESTSQNQFLVRAGGGVGIGTNSPRNQLDVVRNKSGSSANANHVMVVDNTATSQGNVLGLRTNATTPGAAENFITFKAASSNVGAIEGDGSGGITLTSGSADFAEYLRVADGTANIRPADIVGVVGDTVSLQTGLADRAMVVSTRPIMTGNDPGLEAGDRDGHVPVAFLGQVPVRVTGAVNAGDYLVPSGLNDGTGIGVAPGELSADQLPHVVGRALETSETESDALVRAMIGLPQTAIMATVIERRDLRLDQLETRVTEQSQQLVGLHEINTELHHELERLASRNAELRETVRALVEAREQSRELKARIAKLEAILLEQSKLAEH